MKTQSFALSEKTSSELDYLIKIYGENRSRVLSRLIAEKYNVEKTNKKPRAGLEPAA